ncbi:hypothetical protein HDU92_000791 [Lobulomyces angularis]|nr:hypothetical protein HDU92_000791 [Lobulomyces angularis]
MVDGELVRVTTNTTIPSASETNFNSQNIQQSQLYIVIGIIVGVLCIIGCGCFCVFYRNYARRKFYNLPTIKITLPSTSSLIDSFHQDDPEEGFLKVPPRNSKREKKDKTRRLTEDSILPPSQQKEGYDTDGLKEIDIDGSSGDLGEKIINSQEFEDYDEEAPNFDTEENVENENEENLKSLRDFKADSKKSLKSLIKVSHENFKNLFSSNSNTSVNNSNNININNQNGNNIIIQNVHTQKNENCQVNSIYDKEKSCSEILYKEKVIHPANSSLKYLNDESNKNGHFSFPRRKSQEIN